MYLAWLPSEHSFTFSSIKITPGALYNAALSVIFAYGVKAVKAQSTDEISFKKESLRERKRKETKQRIAETGLKLFIANGYEGTTLDAIAAKADISRRTFFYYFKSKEELLSIWQNNAWEALRADLIKESPDQAPLDVVCNVLLKHISRYETDEMIIIDRLLRSTDLLQGRKQANYEVQEQLLFIALCELWPEIKRRAALRLTAMISIGAMRLAIDAWNDEWAKRPIKEYLQDAFANLKAEL